jgi:murein DD-endopeptidase MepM/ murein hydrolase activator NlpD
VSGRWNNRALRGLIVGVIAGLCAWWVLPGPGDPSATVRTVYVPTPPPHITVVESLESGQTLAEIFGSHGLSGLEIMRVVEKIEEFHSPRRLKPGTAVHLAMRPDEPPTRITLQLDRDRRLYLFPEGEEGAWGGRLDSVQVVRDTILIAGFLESNLYEAGLTGDVDRLAPGEKFDVAFHLEHIFAWQIDFWRDIQPGDGYRAVFAREVRPDGTIRSSRILAAEFRNVGRSLTAVRFRPDSTAPVEYYDLDGEAVRGQFLLAPLDLARVTSGFSRRRYHPILKRRRPHLGVDYGAPRGTPVRATGGGIVVRAGRWGTYGTMVEVRHANNLRTRYAHLSRISDEIRAGMRVDQGQVIGGVGATGLATASHLHYEFLQNGSHVNPARLNLPRAEPVSPEHRDLYDAARDAAFAVLQGIEMPRGSDLPASRVGVSRAED